MKTFLSACLLAAFVAPIHADPETKPAADPKVTTTIANLRQLYLALVEFDTDYGAFPNDETAVDVTDATGTKLTFKGGTSNACFRQLLAAAAVKTEKVFQIGGAKLPDDDFKDDSKALAKGECGISYVPGLATNSSPDTPLAFAPLAPGKLKFDPVPLAGKAVILRVDGAVTVHTITPDGDVMVDGKSILDPKQSFWKGKEPKVAWPE
ncbi:hypothetical protein OKA05_09105 [Luteolibacter arcticus]|uniref:Uncharacterized protein n=1 Tax=Luteolibacter arcticus TaxID=1581411 RepID=A0ABT3GGG7_9BACT|nr:hypothetical protein [Luteolibacter arcticus]MCW1922709.1 hypothetical protein [Luteolibacter arcticus]